MTSPVLIPGSDAFPVMKAGSATTGQNNQDDFAKLFFQGLLFNPGAGGFVRRGVLHRGVVHPSTGAPYELQVLELANGPNVQIIPGLFVVQRGDITPPDRGVRWGGGLGSTPITLNIPAAPGANTRYDGVFAQIIDKNITQDAANPAANSGAYVAVISGTVGGSLNINGTPGTAGAPPATPDGYLPLAFIARATNDNTIAQADITDVRRGAALVGTTRVMFPWDIQNIVGDTGRYLNETRYRPAAGVYPAFTDRWDGTTWRGTCGPIAIAQPAQSATGNLGANTSVTVAAGGVVIPWPGFPYRIKVTGRVTCSGASAWKLDGEINFDTNVYTAPNGGTGVLPASALAWDNVSTSTGGGVQTLKVDAPTSPTVSDGNPHTIYFLIYNDTALSVSIFILFSYKFVVEIIPV